MKEQEVIYTLEENARFRLTGCVDETTVRLEHRVGGHLGDHMSLSHAEADALALWLLKRNPRLLTGLLSPEEIRSLEWAEGEAERLSTFGDAHEERTMPPIHKALQSILDRFKEG